jgi:dTDP-4-dehydrorhamnose 3,5-epimerase
MKSQFKFTLIPTAIADVFIIEPKIIDDEFGWHMESFDAQELKVALGCDVSFVQENQSLSNQWTLHGMHYQKDRPQGKLVSVIQGLIFDVVVDVREKSATYGKWFGLELSAENHKQIWAPPGLAHGFLTLSSTAEILYKTTDYYHPQSEICLAWDDLDVAISWPLPNGIHPILSAKDRQGQSLKRLVGNTK